MAGQSQAVNLGGMLSQIGNSMGSMGSAGNGLLRPLENTFRPEVDPTDIGSMQNLMQWQSGMGRSQEAALTGRTIADMEAKQYRAAKDAEAAEAKAQKLRHDKMVMGFRDAYANAKTEEKREQIRRSASMVSQAEGVDMLSGINQIDQMDRAVAAEERARANHQAAVKSRARAETTEKLLTAWQTGTDEQRKQAEAELAKIGAGGALQALEDRKQRQTSWEQAQADRKQRKSEEVNVAVTAGERKVLDAGIDAVAAVNPEYAERLRSSIESLENDKELPVNVKRERIDSIRRNFEGFNTNNESAKAAAARKAANTSSEETLERAPAGLWEPEDSYYRKVVDKFDISGASRWWANTRFGEDLDAAADLVDRAIDEKGAAEMARLTASFIETYGTSEADAVLAAATMLMNPKSTAPATAETKPATSGPNSGTVSINLDEEDF